MVDPVGTDETIVLRGHELELHKVLLVYNRVVAMSIDEGTELMRIWIVKSRKQHTVLGLIICQFLMSRILYVHLA